VSEVDSESRKQPRLGPVKKGQMTVIQIQQKICERKPCSLLTVRRYIRKAKLQPLGARQRPQNYPEDSAERILAYLGLNSVKMPTLGQLKTIRTKAVKARGERKAA
jgi:uncharacterized protein YjbK